MKAILPVGVVGLALLVASSPAQARLKVVATTPDLGALAHHIGGDLIDLTVLARPTEDAHFVDPKPSFVLKLNRADVLIEGGAELELGWLPPLLEQARNPKLAAGVPGRVDCSRGIEMLEVPASVDRSKGDIHALGNPHYLLDPANARIVAATICDALCRSEEKSAPQFRANLERFQQALTAKLVEWQKLLAPCAGKRIVSYHNSWPYFSRRFGLRIDLFLEPKPGIAPSGAHLAGLVETMKAEKVRVILVEPQMGRKTAESVARSVDSLLAEVAQFPGGLKGTENDYIGFMDRVVRSIARTAGAN
jgi:zinc/manganese transport system substrate-binding protein